MTVRSVRLRCTFTLYVSFSRNATPTDAFAEAVPPALTNNGGYEAIVPTIGPLDPHPPTCTCHRCSAEGVAPSMEILIPVPTPTLCAFALPRTAEPPVELSDVSQSPTRLLMTSLSSSCELAHAARITSPAAITLRILPPCLACCNSKSDACRRGIPLRFRHEFRISGRPCVIESSSCS